jgi:hypothetical protein
LRKKVLFEDRVEEVMKSDATRAKFWEIITGDFGAPRGLERASFLLFLLMVKTKTGWQNLQMTKN